MIKLEDDLFVATFGDKTSLTDLTLTKSLEKIDFTEFDRAITYQQKEHNKKVFDANKDLPNNMAQKY